jgi:Protein of unknown function (DUF3102)
MTVDKIIDTEIVATTLPELASLANQYHAEAEGNIRSAVECAWHAGTALQSAKALCERGEWLPWLEANFHGSHDTASRYIKLASNFASVRNLDSSQSITEALKTVSNGHKPAKPKRKPPQRDVPAATPATTSSDTDLAVLIEQIGVYLDKLSPIIKTLETAQRSAAKHAVQTTQTPDSTMPLDLF